MTAKADPVVDLFADPIRERLHHLADRAEVAERAQTELRQAATTLTDQRDRLRTEQTAVTEHWHGTAASSFTTRASAVTGTLTATAEALSGAGDVLTGVLGEIRTGHAAISRIVDEYVSAGNQLMAAAAKMVGNGHPTALIDAIGYLSKLSKRYAGEADTALHGVRTALDTATTDLATLERMLPTPPRQHRTQQHPTRTASATTVHLGHGLGTVTAPNPRAATAVRAALTQLGVPYVWGGESPGHAFDCSGLTSWAYAKAGISLPHYASSQRIGRKVSEKDLAPGDLVIFSGHVTMYLGKGHVIAAPHTGTDVRIEPLFTDIPGDPFLGFWRPSVR